MDSKFESIDTTFSELREWINNEGTVRDNIRVATKELDDLSKDMAVVLQDIHSEGGVDKLPEICTRARQFLPQIQSKLKESTAFFPPTEYYRYHELWWGIMQRLSCLSGLIVFLESGKFATREDVAAMIGAHTDIKDGFILDLEDYLTGILYLCSDLSRFAVNSVINNNYEQPLQILKFLTELSIGFRLLNFKNDWLRKRFDALKYDVKKVEEIVYDLSIRGLVPNKSQKCSDNTNINANSETGIASDGAVVSSDTAAAVTSSETEVASSSAPVASEKSSEETNADT